MKRLKQTLYAGICCAAIFLSSTAFTAKAETIDPAEPILVYGQVTKEGEGRLYMIPGEASPVKQEMVITASGERTRILDATTGLPVAFSDIRDGETVYAYIGQAMTLSLPPMTNASLILCNIPADYKVPEFVTVKSTTLKEDQISGTLLATNGTSYEISSDSQLLPYLTRNIVTIHDLTPGRTCLIWSSSQNSVNNASKVLIFPAESRTTEDSSITTGWVQKDGVWYYYNAEGSLHTGWLLENGNWYYLNPSDATMHIGFLTLEGKTYYFQGNGQMLTGSKTFTPDADGVLH